MKKFTAMLLSLLLLLTGCGGENKGGTYRQISQEEARNLMETESDLIILDVRTPEEYAEGHIPGAINLPNEDIHGQDPELLPKKDQKILVYCRSGNRSRQASEKLYDLGYENILEFGGINTWPGEIVK